MTDSTPSPTASESAPTTGEASNGNGGKRNPQSFFFYGTATGVVLATAIALVGFLLMRGQYADRTAKARAERDEARRTAQQWKTQAEAARIEGRLAGFDAAWDGAAVPIQRRYQLLAWRPVPGDSGEYVGQWKERYVVERSAWWAEIEGQYGPASPEEDPEPNPAISREFYRLGVWSQAAGEDRDAEDALNVALRWAPAAEADIIHRALGHRIYRIPDDIADNAPAAQLDKLMQFEGQWVDDSNRHLIERFEAEARGER